jgi:hypothetical protein
VSIVPSLHAQRGATSAAPLENTGESL